MNASMDLIVCMGSACHQMGSFEVVAALKRLLNDNHLQDVINLKGAFCLGECGNGVILDFAGRRFLHVTPKTVETVFNQEILPCLAERNG